MILTVHGHKLDAFTQSYLATMLWSSGDDGEFDGIGIVDLPKDTIDRAVADCAAFQSTPEWLAALDCEDAPTASDGEGVEGQGGHDFWLTRCGHGAGFWDGDWPAPHGDALDGLCGFRKRFDNLDPYMGDDGLIYFG